VYNIYTYKLGGGALVHYPEIGVILHKCSVFMKTS
jgi:hypothetical protein